MKNAVQWRLVAKGNRLHRVDELAPLDLPVSLCGKFLTGISAEHLAEPPDKCKNCLRAAPIDEQE